MGLISLRISVQEIPKGLLVSFSTRAEAHSLLRLTWRVRVSPPLGMPTVGQGTLESPSVAVVSWAPAVRSGLTSIATLGGVELSDGG